jgi:glucose/arabinose dehydrogenase
VKAWIALISAVALAQSAAAGTVRAPYLLWQPAGILALPDGSLLVAERGPQDRILRVRPATGAYTVFARGIPDPFGIARGRDGSFFVSSDSGLYRVPRGGGRARLALPLPTSPLAVAPDGSVYYGQGLEIGRLAPRAPTADVLVSDVNFPHEIALDGRGGLVVSDTGNGRVVRIDLETREETVVAAGLRDPMGLVLEPARTAIAIQFRTGRLLRVGHGPVATVARGLRTPYALTRTSAGRFYVVETGDLVRATGRIARVDPGGKVVRLQLRPR